MKPSPTTCVLMMAAMWLSIAQTNVRIALHSTGDERAFYLNRARSDAQRFRSYSRIWWDCTRNCFA